jgi:hypothetical protein
MQDEFTLFSSSQVNFFRKLENRLPNLFTFITGFFFAP